MNRQIMSIPDVTDLEDPPLRYLMRPKVRGLTSVQYDALRKSHLFYLVAQADKAIKEYRELQVNRQFMILSAKGTKKIKLSELEKPTLPADFKGHYITTGKGTSRVKI